MTSMSPPFYFFIELWPTYTFFYLKGTTVCTASCLQLHKRAERIATVLGDKGHLNAGDNVVLLYPPGKCVGLLMRILLHYQSKDRISAIYGQKGCNFPNCIPTLPSPSVPLFCSDPGCYVYFSISTIKHNTWLCGQLWMNKDSLIFRNPPRDVLPLGMFRNGKISPSFQK